MKRKIFSLSGIFLFISLIGFYIFQLNSLTTLAYSVAATEDSLTQLKHENTSLQQEAYQAVPLRDLERFAQERQFVKINSISYLRMHTGPVAQNQ